MELALAALTLAAGLGGIAVLVWADRIDRRRHAETMAAAAADLDRLLKDDPT